MKEYPAVSIGSTREKSCGITGHRPDKLGGYNENSLINLAIKREIKRGIEELYSEGYRFYHSGFAIGADMFFAEEVLKLKDEYPDIRLIAHIPFEPHVDEQGVRYGQECKWPQMIQEHYHEVLKQCSSVHYHAVPGYQAWKMQYRNKKVAESVSSVISVWDGSSGGTGNFMKMAATMPHIIKYIRINPLTVYKR